MKRYLAVNLLLTMAMSQLTWAAVGFGGGDFRVSLDVDEVVLPDATPVGAYTGEVQVTAIIDADVAHSIGVSFNGFSNESTQELFSDNMTMQVNNVAVLEPGEMGILYGSDTATPWGGAELPLTLRFCVEEISRFTAGRYRCITSLVLMAAP